MGGGPANKTHYIGLYFYNLFLVSVCVGSVYRISLAAFEESVLS